MVESSKRLQVYVVEDSATLVQRLTSAIEGAGAKVVGHSAGAQRAISEISVLQPDLILIDISLESGNGFDVLRELRDRGAAESARKVVLTNHSNAQYRELSFRLGASQFYDKSSEMGHVLALIETMAAAYRTTDGGIRGTESQEKP